MTTQTDKNLLFVDTDTLKKIAGKYSTPLYIYSTRVIQNAFFNYQKSFSEFDHLICYAVKANSNLSILKTLAHFGAGFDIVSGGELAKVIAAGGDPKKIIFSGINKSKEEIKFALQKQIFCFNIESFQEIDRIHHIAERLNCKAPVSFRINPSVDATTHPYISTGLKENKFGIEYEKALEAYQYASSLPFLEIKGIDCHIGSQLTSIEPLLEACEKIILLIDQLNAQNISIEHIDIGGGVGIQYLNEKTINLREYAQRIKKLIGTRSLKLILEPGRSIVGNAGILLTKVDYIKKNYEKNFIIVDAAMNDLIRPAMYQAYHHIVSLSDQNGITPITADVVGPICETGDFFAKDRQLAVKEGDYLCILNSGAYAFSMSSNYNSRLKAAEVLIDQNEQIHLIRDRESFNQLIENEITHLID